MGFWHTGYFEHHEIAEESSGSSYVPPPVMYRCDTCGVEFQERAEFDLHVFRGHINNRPQLYFRSRQCGATRLVISTESTESNWVTSHARLAIVNGKRYPVDELGSVLSAMTSGIVDVELRSENSQQRFQFDFSLAQEPDLDGVDEALERLFEGRELSLRTIDDFLERSKRFVTARDYYSALANYFYGAAIRDGTLDLDSPNVKSVDGYEGKYNSAVEVLGSFDRPAAEAICGLVAFHYNQFELSMVKTKSSRVAEASLRLQSVLESKAFRKESLLQVEHPYLDAILSDAIMEEVLSLTSLPIDPASSLPISEIIDSRPYITPTDELKLRLVAAEVFRESGEWEAAMNQAEYLQHSRTASDWYRNFTNSIERGTNSE